MASERPPSPAPNEPRPIKRLEESLVNRIAAGEIIHRPASALKELIENCLDAGSTQIKVTVKDGGLKLLQIADNGCGIRKSDLPILCERFTTSKLSSFQDLQSLATYGFRGEALASISHVSHLSVVTKTKDEPCAWRACYADGSLVAPKPGLTPDPKPCAGNDGTTISAEDLFYNTPTRLAALRSTSDEYARILDVVTKYAVHNPTVSFTCKKQGFSSPDVSTPSASSVQSNIKLLYGASIARELLHVTTSSEVRKKRERLKGKGKARAEDEDPDWEVEAYATSANYQGKKMVLLLFINHRLVESSRIKRAIEAIYSPVLPKGSSPFIYLSLVISPQHIDVNVHPTKREVHFINEEQIVDDIANAIQDEVVKSGGQSRTFEYQTVLTGGGMISVSGGVNRRESTKRKAGEVDEDGDQIMDDVDTPSGSRPGTPVSSLMQRPKKPLPQHKVRTSAADRTLDSMFAPSAPAPPASRSTPTENEPSSSSSNKVKNRGAVGEIIQESQTTLVSINELRGDVVKKRHGGLVALLTRKTFEADAVANAGFGEIVEKHTFVGVVDLKLSLSLIQHSTKLYLVNHGSLAEEMFYQLALRQFGNFSRIKLEPPPPIRHLIKLAVDAEGDKVKESGMSPEEVTDEIAKLIAERAELLDEYFSIKLNEKTGELESIPSLLKEYTPNLDRLPQFLMRLGPEVNWADEKGCFETLLREVAYFHRPGPIESFIDVETSDDDNEGDDKVAKWQIEHVLFPSMRKWLSPPRRLLEKDVVQVADLPDLYRIFERC
ncbi:DNA mismatch repair protein [Tulasnella sp. UAMH 9824]|nr:DNA mismatch repair protein [Tulasnella sp. UAMH 9824]